MNVLATVLVIGVSATASWAVARRARESCG